MSRPGGCKYCGAELTDYREFCDAFCRSDFEDDKADFYREYDQPDQGDFL